MANTFELISSVTVGSGGASSIDFTSIPTGFTDLCVEFSVRQDQAGFRDCYISFNSSTSNFSCRFVEGNGTSTFSEPKTRYLGTISGTTSTANTFSSSSVYIPNYLSSNYKSYSVENVSENNASTAYATMTAGLWSNTAAITSIGLSPSAGSFVQYSTAYLYGVKNA